MSAVKTNSSPQQLIGREPNVWAILKQLIWLGLIAILVLSIGSVWEAKNGNEGKVELLGFLKSCGTAVLISGACFSAGALTGFLFAIPKLLQNTNLLPEQIKQDQTVILHNDNLVQISDWLTKIIVGVGLTQLNNIPDGLSAVGKQLGKSFGDGDHGSNIASGCVLYFVVVGFLSAYIWTRLYFVKLLRQNIDELQKQQIEKLEKLAVSAVADKNQHSIRESTVASDATSLDFLMENSETVVSSALDELKEKVSEVLKSKETRDTDDLQKGIWGGKSELNGRMIRANVIQNQNSGFYEIVVTVSDKTKVMTEPVAIFVHDSFEFPQNVIYVKPNANGLAQITLTAYEAFTIGALFADGTELELDLNEQKGYPIGFYWSKQR